MYILSKCYLKKLLNYTINVRNDVTTYSVMSAAFHKMVASVAVKMVVPTHHCPPDQPWRPNTSSCLNAAIPKKNNNYEIHTSPISMSFFNIPFFHKLIIYSRVIHSIHDPAPKSFLIKKLVLLAKHIKLRIFI
jgi:hypothetical protein